MTKSKSKILIFILLLFIVATCFCGCASVNVMTQQNDDGTIDELVYVTLNTDAIQSAGKSVELLKLDVDTEGKKQIDLIIEKFENKIMFDKLHATEEAKVVLNSYVGGITPVKSQWQDNTCAIGIRFKSIEVYRYYYGITGNETITMQVEKHFLYNKMYYYAYSMYADYSVVYSNLENIFSTKYPDLVDNQNNQTLYTFVTSSRRQHSDANFVTSEGGKYYHTWILDDDNLDKPVMLYYNVANRGNCILICIGASVIVCGIILGVGLLIEKNKKKKKTVA
ncbi:MAG: hypothetical protein IKM43_00160 [Clostridia bacterium]|nr:hypothetical protein [Clostridia bacterium]